MREKHVTIYIKCISADFRQTAANVMPTSVKQPPEVPHTMKKTEIQEKMNHYKKKKGTTCVFFYVLFVFTHRNTLLLFLYA